jgi:hypothetical protein
MLPPPRLPFTAISTDKVNLNSRDSIISSLLPISPQLFYLYLSYVGTWYAEG